jgi:hypothetical protein
MACNQVIDRAGRDPLEVGLLHHRGERLLGHPARVSPVPVTVAVALGRPLCAILATGGAGKALNLKLDQAMGCKPDHLAQQVGVRGLLDQRTKVHHLVGHWWLLGQVGVCNPILPAIRR